MAKLTIPKLNAQDRAALEGKNIKLIERISVEDFEVAIVDFLQNHNMLHLATCRDNAPRSTPLEYWNDGLAVHIFSEGGGKIANLKANPQVAFSISDPYYPEKDFFNTSGLQVWGIASMFKKNDDPKRCEKIRSHSHYAKNPEPMARQGIDLKNSRFNFNVITIEPKKIRYLNLKKGFRNVMWKSD